MQYEFTRWYRAMTWTAVLPSVAGMVSAYRLIDRATDGSRCMTDVGRCPKDFKLMAVGIGALILTESFGAFSVMEMILAGPRPRGTSLSLAPWSGVLTGVTMGVLSYMLISNDGYGSTFYKRVGYADIPLALLATATSVGTLVAGADRPIASLPTVFVGPGFAGMALRF